MLKTKGLEGVVATTSSISSIVDDTLEYVGFDIDGLVNYSDFEEVIYLLWFKKLPTLEQLDQFRKELAENASLPPELLIQMQSFTNKNIHPMTVLRSFVSLLAMYDEEADQINKKANYRKAIRLQAKIPTIIAAYARLSEGKEPIVPKTDLSLSANFLYMLNGKIPDSASEEAFNKALVLHADHELNASTFTARVCVATLSDMYSGITAAIGALKGALHGGANERVMEMLIEINEEANIKPYLARAFANKEKIMGFGHRVYKNGDPRAKYLREMSRKLVEVTGEKKWYNMSIAIERIVREEKGLLPNVDFYSASVYQSLGIKQNLFTPIFAISRTSGWIGHILEQYENNRLIRPRSEYIGPKHQDYVPIQER